VVSNSLIPTPVKPAVVVSLLAFNYFSGVIPFTPTSQRRFFFGQNPRQNRRLALYFLYDGNPSLSAKFFIGTSENGID
jgi:hypothetical protein